MRRNILFIAALATIGWLGYTASHLSPQLNADAGAALGSNIAEMRAEIEARHKREQDELKKALVENARRKEQAIQRQQSEQAARTAVWDEIERLRKQEEARR